MTLNSHRPLSHEFGIERASKRSAEFASKLSNAKQNKQAKHGEEPSCLRDDSILRISYLQRGLSCHVMSCHVPICVFGRAPAIEEEIRRIFVDVKATMAKGKTHFCCPIDINNAFNNWFKVAPLDTFFSAYFICEYIFSSLKRFILLLFL